MLGAIIETKTMGNHYVKLNGPADMVEKLAEGFKKSLKELRSNRSYKSYQSS